MKNMDLTILDVIEFNKQMKFLDVAKTYAPVGREKLREAMKLAGATFDQQTKRWDIQKGHANEKKRVLDFVQSSRITKTKREKGQGPLRVDPVTGQSQLDDGYFEIETKQEKIIRKKISLDLDIDLHKSLKHIALDHDIRLYVLVEDVLREYIKNQHRYR